MNISGDELEVVIERKKIKNIYFRINENRQIYVTCPRLVRDKEIYKLLADNKKSLEKMYKKVLNDNAKFAKVMLLGKELEYVYSKKIAFKDRTAYGPSIEAINLYLERKSLKVFQDRLNIIADTFNNLPKFRLRIRKMKSRWGVCNRGSMTVTLNSLLIHKRVFLIDYVIVHELSHWSHMDHSAAFWREVEAHFPEYKKARKELRD
ncbi:MAG: DUF45 domain-containing protein [Bacilli bacterium]|nr:DUF45 domain-containing protein [Bacilli bacterium]